MKRLVCVSIFFFSTITTFEGPTPGQWVCPLGQDSGVVFFQGASNSLAQAAMYMVGSSFVSPNTQEKIYGDKGITIFKNVCVDPELPSVIPASKEPLNWMDACLHPLTVLEENASRKQYESSGIHIQPQINSCPTHTLAAFSIDHKKVTLGQMPDVWTHEERAKNFGIRFGNMPQIWHGQSCGAAVTLVAAALAHKQNPELLKTVKLIFLEGCYGSVESDLHALTDSQIAITCASAYFSWWYAYKPNGINPLQVLKDFPRAIATVFITSKADKQVPKEETDTLVSELVNAGHENIYYLILQNSSHGNYVASNRQDADTYQAFSHALYKELYLPYLPAYALAGVPLLAQAKNNAQALKKIITLSAQR